jgi:molybdenum cofactor biosynthesis enzyme MoaA
MVPTINVADYEIFKFAENIYEDFTVNGHTYQLNKHPYLDIVLTDKCNQNCKFCIADLVDTKDTLPLETAKNQILYAKNNLNITEVLLLGGEPTIYPHLLELIKWLSTVGLDKIIMTSNGFRLKTDLAFTRKLFEAGLTNLNISYMSTDATEQRKVTSNARSISLTDIRKIYEIALEYDVHIRINNNIYKFNNDTVVKMYQFYKYVHKFCHSIKFSPLFATDAFSVKNITTEWVDENRLSDCHTEQLFNEFEEFMLAKLKNTSLIENTLQFGFVKNTLIPLEVPIIMNWNFGKYTGMMNRVTQLNQINNVKLLANGALSLSWNKNCKKYVIHK